MGIIETAVWAVAALYALFLKIDIYKVVGYDVIVDVLLTVGLTLLFMGTYSGAAAAMTAGFILSIVLRLTRLFIGYKRLVRRGGRFVWYYYEP